MHKPVSSRTNAQASEPHRRPDRWSVQALAIERAAHDVAASGPRGKAMSLICGRISTSDAVSDYLGWSPAQRLEFAETLSASGNARLKHAVEAELAGRMGKDLDPQVAGLLSFRPVADEIALAHVESKGRSANTIAAELAARYPDPTLRLVLADSFEAASSLCEDKQARKNMARVCSILRERQA